MAMPSARAELARRVLSALTNGDYIPEQDAVQLRTWAVTPVDAMLSLEEIARGILIREENQKARGQGGG
jgi:hypothetical protein